MNDLDILIISISSGVTLFTLVLCICFCKKSRISPAIQRENSRRSLQSPRPTVEEQPNQIQTTQSYWNNSMFIVPYDEESSFGVGPQLDIQVSATCQICLESMDGYSTIGKLHPCDHIFHRQCIYKWFAEQYQTNGQYSCPICRDPCPPAIVCTKIVPLRTTNT